MSKKGYSKGELKARRTLKFVAILVTIIIIICICFFVFVVFKNNIVMEKVDYTSSSVSDDVVNNATPIILNNAVIGATYNKQWVASESYYFRNQNKLVDIDIYNDSGKKGKYKITNYANSDSSGTFYVTTDTPNSSEEFLAVGSSKTDIMMQPAKQILTITDEDIKLIKKALGVYKIFNTTIKINSVHSVNIDTNNRGKIYCVTNESGKSSGAYSAVIYISNVGKSYIIKYNYIKDLKNSSDWPIYSFKFLADLNQDGINDIIIQETKEFDVKYDVIEFKNNKFVEVLSTQMKMK